MADLGNIGVYRKPSFTEKWTVYAWDNLYTSTATITGGTAGEIVYLFQGGGPIVRNAINSSGNASFYDLEDGEYHARECTLDTHAWKIEVSGGSVTVTPLSGGGGGGGGGTTRAYGFFGT